MPINAGHVDKILGMDVTTMLALGYLLFIAGAVASAVLLVRWWTNRDKGERKEKAVAPVPTNGDGPPEPERRVNCEKHITAVAELSKMVDHLHERINVSDGRMAMTETNVQMLQRAVTLNSQALQELKLSHREITGHLTELHEKGDVSMGALKVLLDRTPGAREDFSRIRNGGKRKTATQWARELMAPPEASPGAEEV